MTSPLGRVLPRFEVWVQTSGEVYRLYRWSYEHLEDAMVRFRHCVQGGEYEGLKVKLVMVVNEAEGEGHE